MMHSVHIIMTAKKVVKYLYYQQFSHIYLGWLDLAIVIRDESMHCIIVYS